MPAITRPGPSVRPKISFLQTARLGFRLGRNVVATNGGNRPTTSRSTRGGERLQLADRRRIKPIKATDIYAIVIWSGPLSVEQLHDENANWLFIAKWLQHSEDLQQTNMPLADRD
jgi:hypothetical protein